MRTRVHLCPFLETDGTPLKNRFELFSLLKPADDLPLFWLDVLLLLAWIIPDCGESDAPFPLTNFAQPFNGKCSCDCSTQPPSFHFICVVHNFLRKRIHPFLWMCLHVWRVFFFFCFWFFVNDFEFYMAIFRFRRLYTLYALKF